MLTRIEIDGFKSFVDFELDLEPFTVLSGPDNSGKSNLLEAIVMLRDLVLSPDERPLVQRERGTGVELFHRADDGVPVPRFTLKADIERISLDRLAEAPAYQSFLQDLTTALKELNFR